MALEVLRRRGLTPLAPGGGGGSDATVTARTTSMPSLVTPPLTNSVVYFEDFNCTATIAPAGFASGLTGTPDTLTNLVPYGAPPWVATEIVGTTGTANQIPGGGSQWLYNGVVQVASGTTSGNTLAVEMGGGNTATGSVFWDATHSVLLMARVAASSPTSRVIGVGLTGGIVVGTDWITDPDTLFTGKAALVFHSSSVSYSGDTAGALVLRYYDIAGTTNFSQELVTAPSNTFHKIECYIDGPTALMYMYVNGTQVGAATAVAPTVSTLRWSAQAQTLTAQVKRVDVDCVYQESQLTTAR